MKIRGRSNESFVFEHSLECTERDEITIRAECVSIITKEFKALVVESGS